MALADQEKQMALTGPEVVARLRQTHFAAVAAAEGFARIGYLTLANRLEYYEAQAKAQRLAAENLTWVHHVIRRFGHDRLVELLKQFQADQVDQEPRTAFAPAAAPAEEAPSPWNTLLDEAEIERRFAAYYSGPGQRAWYESRTASDFDNRARAAWAACEPEDYQWYRSLAAYWRQRALPCP